MEGKTVGKDVWNWGVTWRVVLQQYGGNFLESMKVILIRTRSNGGDRSLNWLSLVDRQGFKHRDWAAFN